MLLRITKNLLIIFRKMSPTNLYIIRYQNRFTDGECTIGVYDDLSMATSVADNIKNQILKKNTIDNRETLKVVETVLNKLDMNDIENLFESFNFDKVYENERIIINHIFNEM